MTQGNCSKPPFNVQWSTAFKRLLLCLSVAFSLTCITTAAQNFDRDSIYYTPIPRTQAVKSGPSTVNHVRIFRDTTEYVRPVGYYMDFSIGTLTGCVDCVNGMEFTFSSAMTHGITLGRKTRVGLGVGFDTYASWKALPLFTSASYDIVGTKNTHAIFVQGQYGWGFAWYHAADFTAPTDENGGAVFAALVGYRIKYHNLRVAISTGYKRQSASLIYETPSWHPNERGVWVEGSPNRRTVDIDMGRATLNVIFSWK